MDLLTSKEGRVCCVDDYVNCEIGDISLDDTDLVKESGVDGAGGGEGREGERRVGDGAGKESSRESAQESLMLSKRRGRGRYISSLSIHRRRLEKIKEGTHWETCGGVSPPVGCGSSVPSL